MQHNSHRFSISAVWRSWLSLPIWVQIWVGVILVPVNVAAFFMVHTPTGKAAAIAAIFVVLTNVPIMLYEGGMSRLMAMPHLIAWIPLSIYIIARILVFSSSSAMGKSELIFAIIILVVNGISLIFDAMDTVKWSRGERNIPGHN
jgi:hypothetical protein